MGYKKAALEGNVKAMLKYGMALIDGSGVAKDEALGFSWLKKAANTGDAIGMTVYGCRLIITDKIEFKNLKEVFFTLKKQ